MLACKSVLTWAQGCKVAGRAFRAFSNMQHGDYIVGIDFGTTNSRLAIMKARGPTLLETESGRAISSFVAIEDNKKIVVGDAAKGHAIAYPADGFFNIKILLGRKFCESHIQELKTKVPYMIIEGSNGEAWVEACGEQFPPTRVFSYILAKLKKLAESYSTRSISKAVIAAPAYFSDTQKKEIELAGKLAGLDVLGIVDEPIAAALSCKNLDNGTFGVFSLGGGTFNITILQISDGVAEVKAKESDSSLGGEDFDRVLVEYLVEEIRKVYSVDLSGDRIAMMMLKEAAENAKLELSSSHRTFIDVSYIAECNYGPVHVNISLARSKFEELVEFLIERIRKLCQECLEAVHVNVDEVILVGGMTRVPRVQQIIQEVFLTSPCVQQVNAEEAVAIGALLHGALIIEDQWKLSPHLVPLSLGIETLGGGFLRIIDRHSAIPIMGSRTITTSCDNHDGFFIRILQGEHMIASRNKLLGELKVSGIPQALRGVVTVNLDFYVNSNGVLTVSAKSKDTDLEWSTEIKYLDEITEDCVRMAAKSAILFGRRNMEKFIMMQLRSLAELRIQNIEKMLNVRRKQLPPKVFTYFEGQLADLKKRWDLQNLLALKLLLGEAAKVEKALVSFQLLGPLRPEDHDDLY